MATPASNNHFTLNNGCQVNFISWNVRGMYHPTKHSKILSHLLHLKGNIVFLQETHLKNSDHQKLKSYWVGQMFHSKFNAKAHGTAVLIDKHTPFIASDCKADPNGRYVIVTGSIFNTPIILANVYAPNWDDHKFFSDLLTSLPQVNSHRLILGGDMNMVMNPALDRSSQKPTSISKSAQVLQSYLRNYGAVDIWRFLNPSTKQYSFFSSVHQTYSRIDYFFVDQRFLEKVKTVISCVL